MAASGGLSARAQTEKDKIMRQIAFFTADWNYELVGETLRGVEAYLQEHPDVRVRIFDCFGMDKDNIEDRYIYEIYGLADFSRYDGAIIQAHQIVLKDIPAELEKRVRESGIPALTIGTELGGLPLIRTDDYTAFRQIVSHLAEKHGARKLWFLQGLEQYDETGEAVQRRIGFRDACRDCGIPEENLRYLEGTWKAAAGEAAARAILEAEEKPDALVCANDDMALGAMSVLRDAGIRVPEEVIVTGFDGIFSSKLCTPGLATVDRNFSEVGYLALETIMAMIEGRPQPPEIFSQTLEALTGTCGCRRDEQAEVIRIKDRFFRQTQFLRRFYLTQDKFATAAFAAREPEDVMGALEKYRDIFGEGDFRIYLDEDYYNNMMSEGESARELEDGQFSRRFVLAADSQKPVAWDGNHQRISVGGTQLREPEGDSQSSRMTIYYPLSFGNIMIGVLMLNGLSASAEMNLHESIINMIVFSLENIRQRKILNRLNRKLNNLYVTDQLTGLNNRFGIDRFGQPLFDRLREEGQEIRFLFLDIDDMKGINDRYGHETGDTAIRTAANILRKLCRPGDFLMRYGGDEFIAIGPADSRDPERLAREELRRVEKSLPCPLGISVGTYVRKPDSTLGLDGCLKEADARMYEIKNLKKKEESAKAGEEEGSV